MHCPCLRECCSSSLGCCRTRWMMDLNFLSSLRRMSLPAKYPKLLPVHWPHYFVVTEASPRAWEYCYWRHEVSVELSECLCCGASCLYCYVDSYCYSNFHLNFLDSVDFLSSLRRRIIVRSLAETPLIHSHRWHLRLGCWSAELELQQTFASAGDLCFANYEANWNRHHLMAVFHARSHPLIELRQLASFGAPIELLM